jgi:hypothetical protein
MVSYTVKVMPAECVGLQFLSFQVSRSEKARCLVAVI